jgi:ribosome maturation factor RimP
MSGHSISEQVKQLVLPIVESQHLELVDVEFKHEGHVQYLRIFIDKPGGVTLDDCQSVSRECEVVLDIEDIIRTQYVLEVSSPGLDRPLKKPEDFNRFRDRLVKIKTFQAIQGRKKFLGYLQGITEETSEESATVILVSPEKEEWRIPYTLIASARLEIEF